MKTRSKFEAKIVKALQESKIKFTYESQKYKYTEIHHYTPDIFLSNGVIIEIKGFFRSADRSKHLNIKRSHPELDIRFVFQKASNTITKTSKTTYGDWATKNGFKWAEGDIPPEWVLEKRR